MEKSFHLTGLGKDIKEKTVCEDGVQVLHSSEVKINLKPQENKNELESDGPIQLAPNPAESFIKNIRKDYPPIRPQRHWEPEGNVNNQGSINVVNSWPTQNPNKNLEFNRPYEPYNRSPLVHRRHGNDNYQTPQNPKFVEKSSFYISSTGEDGEEIIEENTICEDGFQVYHSSAYKKKMKRLEKLRQKNTEELESMKRNIATRFLLTKAKPSMTENAVEKYILENFEVDEVYVRKNQMKYPKYSSFIFIINSEEELDIGEFEQHQWPGLLRCFFAPREENRGH